jgi:hypothetical protein
LNESKIDIPMGRASTSNLNNVPNDGHSEMFNTAKEWVDV